MIDFNSLKHILTLMIAGGDSHFNTRIWTFYDIT